MFPSDPGGATSADISPPATKTRSIMGEASKISWTDHTFNPWLGCTRVSPGCEHCYAEAWAKRSGLVKWGKNADRRRTSDTNWGQPLKWERAAAAADRPALVFSRRSPTCSKTALNWRRGAPTCST